MRAVIWGPTQDLVQVLKPGFLFILAQEEVAPPGIFLDVGSSPPPVQDGFKVLFASAADRTWNNATIPTSGTFAFAGVQSLAIPGESFGARFIYGQPLATTVPDGGSTMLLLAGVLGAVGFVRIGQILPVRASLD